jgi:hypothetical protein
MELRECKGPDVRTGLTVQTAVGAHSFELTVMVKNNGQCGFTFRDGPSYGSELQLTI